MADIQSALKQYTADEKRALRGLFDIYDRDHSGFINDYELSNVLEKVGRDPAAAETLLKSVDPDQNGKISFDEFLFLLTKGREPASNQTDGSGAVKPDQKVLEFLKILDEYRVKCEEEGNYMEAERATKQLKTLRKQEERRQCKSLRAKQISERQDVQIAHNMQYAEFNAAWDKYMEEYDQMAQMYIQQMTEKHSKDLGAYQEKIAKDVTSKPPKFSKELLNWRRRQHLLAKQKNYAEAQKLKRLADKLEEKERRKLEIQQKQQIAKREAKFRAEQQKELAALLKRIDGRRKEHIKQRNEDSKRLLQRNRNVQQVLESKQAVQMQRQTATIKTSLQASKSY